MTYGNALEILKYSVKDPFLALTMAIPKKWSQIDGQLYELTIRISTDFDMLPYSGSNNRVRRRTFIKKRR